ncbi:MAG TPA: glycoside hydrolase family 52 protein [Candidatus Methylacidiphilales bacterium]
MQTDYHTQHAPFGAFASFTVGLHGAPGGFGQSLPGPANQNHYVGFRKDGVWRLLPFLRAAGSALENFAVEGTRTGAEAFVLAPAEFDRALGWASDTWTSGPFSYGLYSPFGEVPDPETCPEEQARFLFAPVLFAKLAYDNREGDGEVELLFGLSNPDQPWRPLRDEAPGLNGFAVGGRFGFAVGAGEDAEARQCFDLLDPGIADGDGLHRIANQCGLLFRVPAGERREAVVALGFFEGGIVTGGIPARYWYARHFASLEEVLAHGLARRADSLRAAAARDAELRAAPLSPEQRFLLAQATHSYYGSSQLLEHDGKPLWNVNEGEYRMMNTFDLTADHLFFELRWHPWAVRNVLDLFAARYSYRDTLHSPDGRRGEGGVSFTHDMGVMNRFAPPGRSSYECTGLTGCFSHMTCEQLVNWVCCALAYAARTGDREWLRAKEALLLDCAESLRRRDDPDPSRRDGILKWDSDRCGDGSEITTYDSLDASLGQARNNLYLAVKTWAAWVLLEKAFGTLESPGAAAAAGETARLLAASICARFEADTGMFPAVFEGGNRSRILPAVEGLVFPLHLGYADVLDRDGPYGGLLSRLESHLRHSLRPGVCLDAASGGWKLSSTSTNTWMSKIALCQHVARRLFPAALTPEALAADRVHAAWESRPGCGAFAMCDQIESDTGRAVGSRYYPRIVTAILWLDEPPSGGRE